MSIQSPVGRVGRHHGRIADRPARQLPQRGLVLVRRRLDDMQIRNERLRLRERHADMQTELLRGRDRLRAERRRDPIVCTVTSGSSRGGSPVRRLIRSVGQVGR